MTERLCNGQGRWSRSSRWAGLGAVFIAAALLAAPANAQSTATPGGDVFDCGGRGEQACPAFSTFWLNGNFGCDRGLKEVDGVCINDKRRQGVGRQFRESELGRTLAMQRRLNWNRPIGLHSDISVHNAYENHADGYPAGSQRYSITEMLDAGFRQIELDLWTDSLGFGYPKLCHGACSAHDRFFSSALKELRDWLKEDGNRNEIVIVLIDGFGFNANQVNLVDASIKAHLADDPAIGVYTGGSIWINGAKDATLSTTTTKWPSPREMVENGTRVLFLMQDDSVGQYLKKEQWSAFALMKGDNGGIKPTAVEGYPTCELVITRKNTEGTEVDVRPDIAPFSTDIDAWMFKEVYPGEFLPTADQLKSLTSCGVDSIKMNYLLQTREQDANSNDPERLKQAVWTWATGEPARTTPGTAVQLVESWTAADEYQPIWHARDPEETAPYVCSNGSWPRPALFIKGDGPWYGGFAACAAHGLEFYAPGNAHETYEAGKQIRFSEGAGKQAWIAVQTTGGIEGFSVRDGHSEIAVWDIAGLGGQFEGTPVWLSISPGQSVTSVEWNFGDGTVATQQGDNVFPNVVQHTWASPGAYWITATLKFGTAVVLELTRTIEVRQLSDSEFGPRITLDDVGGRAIEEGDQIHPSFTAHWPIIGLQCGSGSPVTTPMTFSGPGSAATPTYSARFECTLSGGLSPTSRFIVFAAVPDPATGLPAIDPATGTPITMSKYYDIDVYDGKQPMMISASAAVAQDQVLYHKIEIDEEPGEPLTVTVKWPGVPVQTFATTSGQVSASWRANVPIGKYAVTVTMTDGERAPYAEVFYVTVEPGQPPEIVSMDGPAQPIVGVAVNYNFTALAPAGGTLVPVAASCGDRGTVVAGPSAFQPNPDGSQRFAVRCRFFHRGPSEVSMNFQSSSSALVTGRQYVKAYVDGAPDDMWTEGPPNPMTGQKTTYYFGVQASDGGGVTVVGASCGSRGEVTAGPSWLVNDPADGTRTYGVQCLFGLPGESLVSMTFRGDNGDEVTYTQTVQVGGVADEPPQVVATGGPSTPEPGVHAIYSFTVRDSSNVTAANPSCGTGQVVSGPAFTGFGPDASRIFSLTCSFPATGATAVSLTFTDADGGPATIGTIAIDVHAVLPTIATADATVAATGALTPVAFSISTENATSVSCVPENGSRFPVGATPVTCTAVNGSGQASATFTVTVVDNVAPVLTLDAPAVLEATGPGGAALVYTVSALDIVNGPIVPTCNIAPGAMVAVGASHVIECAAVDSSQNRSTATRTVAVRDSIAPVIAPVAAILVPATGTDGARVSYVAPSTADVVDGTRAAGCTPVSGSLFPVGTTVVTCTAEDAAHNVAAPVTFGVTVTPLPVAPPMIHAPRQLTEEATGPDGARVTFQATARDAADGRRLPVSCAPASGSTFAIGSTLVTCTARNSRGAIATHELLVTVRDTRSPRLDVPERVRVEATGPKGAVATFQASAHDRVDGAVVVACAPASGSVFPLGRTTVRCSARDRHGNEDRGTLDVIVRDTMAPEIRSLTPSLPKLPATGARVPVTIAADVFDAVDAAPKCAIANVTSSVRDADRDGERDWAITGPLRVSLEAATRRHKDRSYRITVRCVDDSGNASRERTAVIVSRMP